MIDSHNIMDCLLPIMDGYEATKSIKSGEGPHAHIPIIAKTANAMKGDKEKCHAVGMDDYPAKLIHAEQLEEILAHWLPTAQASISESDSSNQEKMP